MIGGGYVRRFHAIIPRQVKGGINPALSVYGLSVRINDASRILRRIANRLLPIGLLRNRAKAETGDWQTIAVK